MRVFDHHNGGVDHRSDGNGDAAEAHDVRAEPEHVHAEVCDQYPQRQGNDCDERAAHVKEKHDADERDDGALLDQRPLQGLDGAVDQIRPVIYCLNRYALRQARCDFREAILHICDDRKRVLAKALNRNPRNDLAFPVKLGDAAPFVRCELDPGHVSQQYGHAAVVLDDDLLQVGNVLDIAAAANGELCFGQLDRPTSDVAVARAQSGPNFIQRDT